MSAGPRFTIITPVLNRAGMVAAALDSVRAQNHRSVEHIVVDGGSTDGTLDVVRRYPEVRLLGGPDDGLYDAINKGLAVATGAVVGLVNSDDVLCPGALEALEAALDRHPEADSACGGAVVTGAGGAPVAAYDDEATKRLDFRTAMRGVPITNARFFRRRWFARVGGFDLRYPIAADRDFLIRSLQAGLVTVPVPARVYEYRAHPGSLTIAAAARQGRRTREEYLALARRWLAEPHAGPAWSAQRFERRQRWQWAC